MRLKFVVGALLLLAIALPGQAWGSGEYSLLAEPWVQADQKGDQIKVEGALLSFVGSESPPGIRPDRVSLEHFVVIDGKGRWVVRDNQTVKQGNHNDVELKLSWRVPPGVTGVRVRTVAYRGQRVIANSGWNRLGLMHLQGEKFARDGCVIQAGGQVFCWPINSWPVLGNPYLRKTLTSVPAKTLGRLKQQTGYCGLRFSGQVVCWGDNQETIVGDGSMASTVRRLPVRIPGLTGVKSISSSGAVNCAVKETGGVWCWGVSYGGSIGNGVREERIRWRPTRVSNLHDPKMIDTQGYNSCAVTAEAKVACWGFEWTGPTSSRPRYVPTLVPGLENIVQVGLGSSSCALEGSGQVWCWGDNEEGTLGNGTRKFSRLPVPVSGLDDAVRISIGEIAACAIREGGQVVCWGYNYEQRLGVGPGENILTPQPVPGLDDAREIHTDGFTSCAIRENGEVWCWGWNTQGAVGNGYPCCSIPAANVPVPVRTG